MNDSGGLPMSSVFQMEPIVIFHQYVILFHSQFKNNLCYLTAASTVVSLYVIILAAM